jgi:hypothetical protein
LQLKITNKGEDTIKRSILNGLLLICAGLTVFSGIFMFFHYTSSLTKGIHEISGLAMALIFIRHIQLNRRALINSLGGQKIFCCLLFLLVMVVLIMSVTGKKMTRDDLLKRLQQETGQKSTQ